MSYYVPVYGQIPAKHMKSLQQEWRKCYWRTVLRTTRKKASGVSRAHAW